MGAAIPTITSGLNGLKSVSGLAGAALNAAQTVTDFNSQRQKDNLALDQLRERNDLATTQLAQDNEFKRQEIAIKNAQDEDKRRSALRRSVARQRARFGASGLDSAAASGSNEAVLLGLLDESKNNQATDSALDSLRLRSLDSSQNQRLGLNLLQAAQLEQKQKLGRLF